MNQAEIGSFRFGENIFSVVQSMNSKGTHPPELDQAAGAANPAADNVSCPLCGHAFDPGGLKANMYCPKCGRRFNPNASMDETVAISPVQAEPDASLATADEDRQSQQDLGERFGEYDILSEVARGGMGVVYKARQRTLKRVVALKVLRGGEGARDEDLERFMREAKAAASLSHPNIVPIYELSVYKGQHFFTMEYIEGTPLDRLIDAGGLTPYQACEMIEVIARAIQYAHDHGIIHRDLKPANIIIDVAGRPMLTDFGLAVNLASDVRSQRMTRTGAVMGTIPYIPPEQAEGHVEMIGPRSDVYSLGAVLYEMLTGHPPFQGETQFELLRRVIHQEPVRPRVVNPKTHHDLETICLKCLEKDPHRRYASARELADDCRAFLHGEVIQARPVSRAYRLYRKALRHRALIILISCIVLLALIAMNQSHRIIKEKNAKKAIKHSLDKKEVEKQLAEIEAAEYKKQLVRTWRQEYQFSFFHRFLYTTGKPSTVMPWINPAHVKHLRRQGALQITGSAINTLPRRAAFGLHLALPRDFRFTCYLRVPADKPGTIFFLLDADRGYGVGPGTQLVRIGVPGNPGARIHKGDVTLNENPDFELAATTDKEWRSGHGWQRLELVREGDTTRILAYKTGEDAGAMNHGEEGIAGRILVLENTTPNLLEDSATSLIGIAATNGIVQIRSFTVEVRGMSPAMIRSHLELAGSLDLRSDHRLGLTLYERVANENTQRDIHIKALRGAARCLAAKYRFSRKAASILPRECMFLLGKIGKSHKFERGETQYFIGLAYAAFPSSYMKHKAIGIFDKAAIMSRPGIADLLQPGPCLFIGPFAARDGLATTSLLESEEFSPMAAFRGKTGNVRWRQAGKRRSQIITRNFPGSGDELAQSIFYVRRTYRVRNELPVMIRTGSDDGMVMWVNGKLVLSKDEQRSLKPGSDTIDAVFHPGKNVIFIKVHNRGGVSGFSLEVLPGPGQRRVGVYGLLAKLESIYTLLGLRRWDAAVTRLDLMQKEGDLTRLARDYSPEIHASSGLAYVLDAIDDALKQNTVKRADAAMRMLSAMEVLFPAAGKELAIRYHRYAKQLLNRKDWDKSEKMIDKAIALAPDWYLPHFDRACLYFRKGQVELGQKALADAAMAAPESLDLQMLIAAFYLDNPDPKLHNPVLAEQAARRAVELSQEKNPATWEVLSRALFEQGQLDEARDAIVTAINLERTAARDDLQIRIQQAIEAGIRDQVPREEPGPMPGPDQ